MSVVDGVAATNRHLWWHEAAGQPSANQRLTLDRFAGDERLQDRANTGATRIPIAALLDRPGVANDAQDHIGGRGDALFRDEEVHLAHAWRSKPSKQPFAREGVLNELHVPIEVKPERTGADPAHGRDRCHVSFLSSADQRHWGAVTQRFRHTELNLSHRNDLEAVSDAPGRAHVREEKRHSRSASRRFGEH
jgi:hypothetical protein